MKKLWLFLLFFICLFSIVPISISKVFQNDIAIMNDKHMKIERYLPYLLYETIDKDMHIETLKAQAVILRTNLLKENQDASDDIDVNLPVYTFSIRKIKEEDRDLFKRYERACSETKGKVILYQSKLCKCPYFYCSNGLTRDAFSFFQDTRYPHVISVPSKKDTLYESYVTYHYFSKEEYVYQMNCLSGNTFDGQIEIIEYDDTGYILWLKIGEKLVGGETFRDALGLSSSCFVLEEVAEGIRIGCKGIGHGFGFSQYGANAMAQEKYNYEDLIKYYFHNITIENVYTFQ